MDVFDEPVLLLTGPEPDGVHLLAHGGMNKAGMRSHWTMALP